MIGESKEGGAVLCVVQQIAMHVIIYHKLLHHVLICVHIGELSKYIRCCDYLVLI